MGVKAHAFINDGIDHRKVVIMSVNKQKNGKWAYDFKLGKRHVKGGFETKSAAETAKAKKKKELSKDLNGKLLGIPAMDSELFGNINKNINLNAFLSRGHTPIKAEIKNHRLVDNPDDITQAGLKTQLGYRSEKGYITAKAELPLKLTVSVLYFDKNPTAIDDLFTELIDSAKNAILRCSSPLRREFVHILNEKVSKTSDLFKIKYWVTKNISTGELCKWHWQEVASVEGAKVFKLSLEYIDNKKVIEENFDETYLRQVAGDMWEDECITYIKEEKKFTPMCASKVGLQ